MLRCASVMLQRFEVGKDGMTAYEHCKAKKAKTLGLEFGEALLRKRRPAAGHMAKLTSLWAARVYLGVKSASGEIVVGTNEGVWKTRTVRRRPAEERWSSANMDTIVGVPWRKKRRRRQRRRGDDGRHHQVGRGYHAGGGEDHEGDG